MSNSNSTSGHAVPSMLKASRSPTLPSHQAQLPRDITLTALPGNLHDNLLSFDD